MFCPKLGREASAGECPQEQENTCADCEYFEPFIWFMLEQEQEQGPMKEGAGNG